MRSLWPPPNDSPPFVGLGPSPPSPGICSCARTTNNLEYVSVQKLPPGFKKALRTAWQATARSGRYVRLLTRHPTRTGLRVTPAGLSFGSGLARRTFPLSQSYHVAMLEIRQNCECCDRSLAVHDSDVYICSFECTWCADCVATFAGGACPNCGGNLAKRPIRPVALLAQNPPTTRHVYNPECRENNLLRMH